MINHPGRETRPHGSMVFCDFDGTITERDTLQAVCQLFIPDIAAQVLPAIGRREISLQSGVSTLINNLPAAAAADISDFVSREPLRRGFEQFAQQLKDWNIPLVVLSGGLGFCVEARLQPWRHLIHGMHTLDINFDQTFMRAMIRDNRSQEAVPKAAIMLSYATENRIVIGDSLSDQSMALQADRVFARDRLLAFMRRKNRAVEEFADFEDILAALQAHRTASHGCTPAAVDTTQ